MGSRACLDPHMQNPFLSIQISWLILHFTVSSDFLPIYFKFAIHLWSKRNTIGFFSSNDLFKFENLFLTTLLSSPKNYNYVIIHLSPWHPFFSVEHIRKNQAHQEHQTNVGKQVSAQGKTTTSWCKISICSSHIWTTLFLWYFLCILVLLELVIV